MVAMSENENNGEQHPIVKAKITFHMNDKNESYALINFITLVKDENVSDDIKNLANGYKVHIMRELSSIFVGSKLRYDVEGKHYHFVKKLGEKENILIPVYEESKPETEEEKTDEMANESTPVVETQVEEIETVEAEEVGIAVDPPNMSEDNIEEAVIVEEEEKE